MNIDVQKNLRKETVEGVQTLVVRDSFGHPILLVREISTGTIAIDRAGEDGFERALSLARVSSNGAKYVESRA